MSGLTLTSHLLQSRSIEELAVQITSANGPYIRISDAWQLLGYPTAEAARKAASRDRMPLEVIVLPARRGRFVRSLDLAAWLFGALNGQEDPPSTIQSPRALGGNGLKSP